MNVGILRSKFLKSVLALTSGQFVGMILPILAAPLLGRLYEPKQYGELGGYMAISALFATFGNLQFSQGIVVEQYRRKAASIVWLCYFLSFVSSFCSAIFAVLMIGFSLQFELGLNHWWYLMLPFSTFFSGFCQCRAAIANRLGVYKRLAVIAVVPTVVSISLSIVLGLMSFGVTGLFVAYFVGHAANCAMHLYLVPAIEKELSVRQPIRLYAMFRKYLHFAIFTTPTSFVSSFTLNVPIYALTTMGDLRAIGMFSRANQLLNLPIALVGNSISQVFQRRAAVDFAENGTCWPLFRKSFIVLLVVATLPCTVLMMFAPEIFALFLGPNWRGAGNLAQLMVPMLFLRFVASPLSTVLYVLRKQREDLILTLVGSVITVGIVSYTCAARKGHESTIIAFVLGQSIFYIAVMFVSAWYASRMRGANCE